MEPFKNLFNPQMIAAMGASFKRVWDDFDDMAFVREATEGLDALELKQRSDQIVRALTLCLPENFADASRYIIASLHPGDEEEELWGETDAQGIRGWGTMPLTQYVGERGLNEFDLGMEVQKEITKRGSSEFGIRSFIVKDQERALMLMSGWTSDSNVHVRRLVSEGSRPRLPWGIRLHALVKEPAPLLPILEKLKDDPKEYVRRSVANSLNDIAKDHPDNVASIAKEWFKGASAEREKLVRHACRTLVKAGHKKTLVALGYKKPNVLLKRFEILTPVVKLGEALQFEMDLQSTSTKDQNLVIDYVVHHLKANGKSSPKVFKWKTMTFPASAAQKMERKHGIKPITTRV